MNSNHTHPPDDTSAMPAVDDALAPTLDQSVTRWLTLEAEFDSSGHAAMAEEALAQVISGLPEIVPSAGFAARVLAARAQAMRSHAMAARLAVRDLDRRWQLLTAAMLGLGALTLAFLWPPLRTGLLALEPLTWPAALLDGAAVALSSAVQLASALLVWTDRLAAVGRAASAVLLAPPTLIMLFLLTLLTFVVGRWLVHTLTVQRSPVHG